MSEKTDELRRVVESVKKDIVEMKNWGKVVLGLVVVNLVMCVAVLFLVLVK